MEISLDLDKRGALVHPSTGNPIAAVAVPGLIKRMLAIPPDVTDIVVYVHGWRNSTEMATRNARNLFGEIDARLGESADRYPQLTGYQPCYITVRWPSESTPAPRGYKEIRDRAHLMATEGEAATVLAHLLGYLNDRRRPPSTGPRRLRTRTGQYLHCVGHSFGGRFLCQAIQLAADPRRPSTLAWPWAPKSMPYTVDSLLVFQMAAAPDSFSTTFPALLGRAPINCPIVLTKSSADRATGLWHRLAEGVPGIGNVGATTPPDDVDTIVLRRISENYQRSDFSSKLINIDASWRYQGAGRPSFGGAHSDFLHAESIHLLLSLMSLAR